MRFHRLLLIQILMAGCRGDATVDRVRASSGDPTRVSLEALHAARPEDLLVRYNLGTVLLRNGHHAVARPHLEAAAESDSDAIRQPALYNLGNSDLEPAFAGRASGIDRESLVRAINAYKGALLLQPADQDAKWNLELARRLMDQQSDSPPPQGGGGGGGGGGGNDQSRGTRDPRPQPAGEGGPQPPLSAAEAERILASAQQREIGLQREKLRKQQPRTSSAH